MVDGDPSRRVLISVAPPLLGDLLARELYRADLEIVVAGEHGGFRDRRTFDVVVTNGLPPERVDAVTVVQLPDRVRGDEVGSLVTAAGVERVPIPELACVVDLVRQLCPERRTDRD